jgi:hypothetical protein
MAVALESLRHEVNDRNNYALNVSERKSYDEPC